MARDNEPGMKRGKENGRSGSGKWSKYRSGGTPGRRFDWPSVDASSVLDTIIACTENGAAILYGTTRDGGCAVATVCDGDERIKFYAATVDEFEAQQAEIRRIAREE